MKLEYEIVQPDPGCSFRLIHERVIAEKYGWEYHFHPELEIVCVLNGNGTRHVGNNFSHYENGDLVLIGPNIPHDGFGLNAHGLHEEIVIQVKEEVIAQFIHQRPEMAQIRDLLERGKYGLCFGDPTKENVTRRLKKLPRLSPFEKFLELISILQILATAKDAMVLNPDLKLPGAIVRNNGRLEAIFKYVENHFQDEIDIRRVAAVANLSVPAFCNYFRKLMNKTFTDFMNRYRIQRACLFIEQDKTIYQTCYDCGFNTVGYFNKLFKEITGKTPSAFRKEKLAGTIRGREAGIHTLVQGTEAPVHLR